MSVAAELGKKNPYSRRQVIRSQPLSLMMMNRQNNCPNSHMNKDDRIESRRRVWRLDSETEVGLDSPARPKPVMSRGDQGRNCGCVDRSVEGNDAPTEFEDRSRSRVEKKQSRVEQCNSSVAGRSAMAPSKNSSTTHRRLRDRGEHRIRVSFRTPVFAVLTPGK